MYLLYVNPHKGRFCVLCLLALYLSCYNPYMQPFKSQSAMALLLVMFIVALASMIVIQLTYSTYLGSRISSSAERSVQAEYLLKSGLNFAMVLIKEDVEPGDSAKDIWGKYANGLPIQKEQLTNYTLPDVPLAIEIRPEGAKLNIRQLVPSNLTGLPDVTIREVLARLFTNLKVGYEYDAEEYTAPDSKVFQFKSKDLISNLIDYMDKDETAYSDSGYQGVEGPNSQFPNREITRIGELAAVPGFTAERVKRLLPYLTTVDNRQININLASKTMLTSLDSELTSDYADQIISFRTGENGPFKNSSDLQNILPAAVFDNIKSLVTYESNRYQIIAKAEYSTSVFFLRAEVAKNGRKQLPAIKSIELF